MDLDQDGILRVFVTIIAVGITVHVTKTVPILSKVLSTLRLKWLAKQKSSSPADGSVTGLYIHPVKSLRAVSLTQAQLDEKGLSGDRRFMVVYPAPKFTGDTTTHRFFTQRQCPSLATVVAKLVEEKDSLVLECKGKSITIPITDSIQKSSKTFYAGIWKDHVNVQDMGDDAAAFLQLIVNADENCRLGDEGDETPSTSSSNMYENIRLVSHTANDRQANSKYVPPFAKRWMGESPPVSLTDGFPILIACEASLDELNKRLEANGKETIPMSRFRPNIVIRGTKAFEEDKWRVIAIGEELFAVVKACPRCKQSCTDQETGKVSVEPVATMKSFRALKENDDDVYFAQNAIPLGRGKIQIGDEVRVLQIGDPIYHIDSS